MSKPKELYRFTEAASVPPFSSPQNFYFIIDKSGSMAEFVFGTTTRFQVVISQLKDVIAKIDAIRLEKGVPVDIGVCAFSASSTVELVRRNFTTENISDFNAFLDGLVPAGDTPYNTPMSYARSYFIGGGHAGYQQSLFFVTDGLPTPVSSAYDAANANADMIGRTGAFSAANGNTVDIYGIGIDLADTQYLGLLDNTPRDGIAVINSQNANSMYNIIIATTSADSLTWTLTSADSDEAYNGDVYTSTAIGRDEVEQKNELSKANLTVTVSLDNEMGRRWLKTSVDAVVGLTVFRKDVDTGSVVVAWKGRLASVKPNEKSIQLIFESVFTSLRRPGLRQRYQRTCPHVLYGSGCNLSKEDFAVSGQVTNVSGKTVVFPAAASFPDGWFTAGMIEAPDGTMRFITAHSGQNLTLIRPLDSLSEAFAKQGYGQGYGYGYGGLIARIFPGCDRTTATCASKFNNLVNNGAFPFIPLKNPFGGSSIV